MQGCKLIKILIPVGVKLFVEQCPKTWEEIDYMAHVPYASVVDSLMYEMVRTRPNIAHAVGVLSRYMSTPGKDHWTTVKRVFRYLRGTRYFSIRYQGKPKTNKKINVHGFVNSNWVSDLDQRICFQVIWWSNQLDE